jgi:hypothetical protein
MKGAGPKKTTAVIGGGVAGIRGWGGVGGGGWGVGGPICCRTSAR